MNSKAATFEEWPEAPEKITLEKTEDLRIREDPEEVSEEITPNSLDNEPVVLESNGPEARATKDAFKALFAAMKPQIKQISGVKKRDGKKGKIRGHKMDINTRDIRDYFKVGQGLGLQIMNTNVGSGINGGNKREIKGSGGKVVWESSGNNLAQLSFDT